MDTRSATRSSAQPPHGSAKLIVLVVLMAAAIVANWFLVASDPAPSEEQEPVGAKAASSPRFETTIRKPTAPQVQVKNGDSVVTASCTTCHARRAPNRKTRSGEELDEFHQGLKLAHGKLSCLACHNDDNYDQLALADGTPVEFADVMTLCAQCHGPQTRDYEHGAHGGMVGYWDLSRGPRKRNNCVDCHHPHTPAFPKMKPTFKPRDRFLTDEGGASHE